LTSVLTQQEEVKFEDLKTPHAKVFYRLLDVLSTWLGKTKDPLIEKIVITQVQGAKALCKEIDKIEDNQAKMEEFTFELAELILTSDLIEDIAVEECQNP
jgi:hypothetical protein